jgi:hypothetical protein
VDYQARLESVCSRKVTVGSNPTLSASLRQGYGHLAYSYSFATGFTIVGMALLGIAINHLFRAPLGQPGLNANCQ